jgi:hypothetical protein
MEGVKAIRSGYGPSALDLCGHARSRAATGIEWPAISRETAQPGFWSYANFLLHFAPPLPWDAETREHFARIGVMPSDAWPAADLPADVRTAVVGAGHAALAEISAGVMTLTSSRMRTLPRRKQEAVCPKPLGVQIHGARPRWRFAVETARWSARSASASARARCFIASSALFSPAIAWLAQIIANAKIPLASKPDGRFKLRKCVIINHASYRTIAQ